MDRVLPRFSRALRSAGLRVSVAEEADAGKAIEVVGMAEPALLRSALRATLVKDRRDLPAFDRLFTAFFSAAPSLPAASDQELLAWLADSLDGTAREVARALLTGDAFALEALLAEAQESIDLPLRHPFQRGLLSYRLRERLGVERLRRALATYAGPASGGGGPAPGSGTGDRPATPADPLAALEAAIDSYVARALVRAVADAKGMADRSALITPLENDPAESDAIARAAARLARLLRERTARRRRRNRRGRLDAKATLHRSIATGGVPFTPRFRRVRPDRPELTVLCDVSPSMRAATRFTLLVLHSLAAEVARVRSFFFVDGVAEVTGFFRERRIARAVSRALAEAPLDLGARTDYGSSFTAFDRRFGHSLSARTTLVILGDARSNYTDPGLATFASWRRKVRRIVWLNPEGAVFWGSGDSAMRRFQPLCDFVAECRTPAHLEKVVEALAAA